MFHRRTLTEKVERQQIRDEKSRVRDWKHLVEPYLIRNGYSESVINDYHDDYFLDSLMGSRMIEATLSRNVSMPPTLRQLDERSSEIHEYFVSQKSALLD